MGYLKDYKEKFLNGEEIPSEIIDLVLESFFTYEFFKMKLLEFKEKYTICILRFSAVTERLSLFQKDL